MLLQQDNRVVENSGSSTKRSWRVMPCLAVLLIVHWVSGMTRDDVYRMCKEASTMPDHAFQAKVVTKVYAANTAVDDTGQLVYSPPDCMRMHFSVSNTTVCGCGDTSCVTAANGDVPRTTGGGHALLGVQSKNASSYTAPNLEALLKDREFTIENESESEVVLQLVPGPPTERTPCTLHLNKKTGLLSKMVVGRGEGTGIECGYQYEDFEGHKVLKAVNTVMGQFGFFKVTFSDYRKIKAIPAEKFKPF